MVEFLACPCALFFLVNSDGSQGDYALVLSVNQFYLDSTAQSEEINLLVLNLSTY